MWYAILGVSNAILVIRPYLILNSTIAAEASKGMHDVLSRFTPRRTNDTPESGCDIELREGVWVTTPGNQNQDASMKAIHRKTLYLRPQQWRRHCSSVTVHYVQRQRRAIDCKRICRQSLLVALQRHNRDKKCSTASSPTDPAPEERG